jgi:TPR repeat protein
VASFGWYSLAAKQGHAKAAFNLGLRYTQGMGVGKDPAMAGYWFSVAATKGIFGRKAKVLKGKGGGRQKLQDAYKLEMHISAQETKNTLPGLKTKIQKKSPPRIMPLSEFRKIRWNRNVAKFKKKDDTAGKMIFFEHDKLPRMVSSRSL